MVPRHAAPRGASGGPPRPRPDPQLRPAAAGGGGDDDVAVVRVDAPGDGPGPVHRPRATLRALAGAMAVGRLRRADPGHAADAPALRAVLPVPPPGVGGGGPRAGDQLFGLRG